jgi:hypothetical protein
VAIAQPEEGMDRIGVWEPERHEVMMRSARVFAKGRADPLTLWRYSVFGLDGRSDLAFQI